MMPSHAVLIISTRMPRRRPTSRMRSMSKPAYSPVASSTNSKGGYATLAPTRNTSSAAAAPAKSNSASRPAIPTRYITGGNPPYGVPMVPTSGLRAPAARAPATPSPPAASEAAKPLLVQFVIGAISLNLRQRPVDLAQQVLPALADGDAVVLHREGRPDHLQQARVGRGFLKGHQLVHHRRIGPARPQRQEGLGGRRVVVDPGHTFDALGSELARR